MRRIGSEQSEDFEKPRYSPVFMSAMTMTNVSAHTPGRAVNAQLAPLMVVVLIAFLVIGMALPVLPLHVHDRLGFSALMVGFVASSQFAASLVSRVWSGRTCDEEGPKHAVSIGLTAATLAGFLYLLSLRFTAAPGASVAILLAGRAVLGGAESFIITGATVWGLARVGAQNVGKVIAWTGTAMFAAFAGGAPLGVVLYTHGGFAAVAAATTLAPLATIAFVAPLQAAPAERKASAGMLYVAGKIWLPGLGAAFSSIGFAVIVSFGSLLFAQKGWTPVWLAFTWSAARRQKLEVLLWEPIRPASTLPSASLGRRSALLQRAQASGRRFSSAR
jgi:MFS family permease